MNDAADLSQAAASMDPAQGLVAVRALRVLAERLEEVQVRNARAQGWSWQAIADVLQISRQAVHQKHFRTDAEPDDSSGEANAFQIRPRGPHRPDAGNRRGP
jgi:hypothetical protein